MAWPVTGVGGWEKQQDAMRRICIKSASIRSLIGPGEHKMFRRRLGAEASGRQEGQRASRGRRGDGGHPRRRPALPFARKLVGGMYSCRGHTPPSLISLVCSLCWCRASASGGTFRAGGAQWAGSVPRRPAPGLALASCPPWGSVTGAALTVISTARTALVFFLKLYWA